MLTFINLVASEVSFQQHILAVKATAIRGRTWKLSKAKVDRENKCKLGTLDATNLKEHIFVTLL